MTATPSADPTWADRAAARSPVVQRSRDRSIQQATQIVDAAMELIDEKGSAFTIQELAKHARVALQTFYRHFAGKDELLLAVLEHILSDSMLRFEERALELPDPLRRLQYYVTVTVSTLDDEDQSASRRFITAEHYRLHQLFPEELSVANRAYTDLLIPEIRAAAELGQLAPADIENDAWYITELVMATFHHFAFATDTMSAAQRSESLWQFCLRALGGNDAPPAAPVARAKAKAKKTAPKAAARAARPGHGSGPTRSSGR